MNTPEELAAEALKRWPSLDPARVEKAVQIASKHGMIYNAQCKPGEFDVRNSKGNGWYHVDTHAKTCTCPDSRQGHTCKHRLAVWMFVEMRVRPAAQVSGRKPEIILKQLGYA